MALLGDGSIAYSGHQRGYAILKVPSHESHVPAQNTAQFGSTAPARTMVSLAARGLPGRSTAPHARICLRALAFLPAFPPGAVRPPAQRTARIDQGDADGAF